MKRTCTLCKKTTSRNQPVLERIASVYEVHGATKRYRFLCSGCISACSHLGILAFNGPKNRFESLNNSEVESNPLLGIHRK